MRHLGFGIGLFVVSSVISTMFWFATAPDLSLNQPSYSPTPPSEVAINDTTFQKQMKASLSEDASEPSVEDRARPIKASYVVGYGVNEEFIKRACSDFTQRFP